MSARCDAQGVANGVNRMLFTVWDVQGMNSGRRSCVRVRSGVCVLRRAWHCAITRCHSADPARALATRSASTNQ